MQAVGNLVTLAFTRWLGRVGSLFIDDSAMSRPFLWAAVVVVTTALAALALLILFGPPDRPAGAERVAEEA